MAATLNSRPRPLHNGCSQTPSVCLSVCLSQRQRPAGPVAQTHSLLVCFFFSAKRKPFCIFPSVECSKVLWVLCIFNKNVVDDIARGWSRRRGTACQSTSGHLTPSLPSRTVSRHITRMHGSALRCVRSHSRSIWNMANLTPL